jgi:hypothetical protein
VSSQNISKQFELQILLVRRNSYITRLRTQQQSSGPLLVLSQAATFNSTPPCGLPFEMPLEGPQLRMQLPKHITFHLFTSAFASWVFIHSNKCIHTSLQVRAGFMQKDLSKKFWLTS